MIKIEEPGVMASPRPAPISSCNDLLIPPLATLGAWVLSISCAWTGSPTSPSTPANEIVLGIELQRFGCICYPLTSFSLHSTLLSHGSRLVKLKRSFPCVRRLQFERLDAGNLDSA